MPAPEPIRRQAGSEETGKYCPYCRFPLKEKSSVVACGVCASPHHEDCWAENSGCAVVACEGGPQGDTGGALTPVPTTPSPPVPPTPPPAGSNVPPPSAPSGKKKIVIDDEPQQGAPPPRGVAGTPPSGSAPSPPPAAGSSSDRNLLIAFAAVVAVGLVGVFLITQTFGGSGDSPDTPPPAAAESQPDNDFEDDSSGSGGSSFGGESGPLAGQTRGQIQRGAQRVIRDYHLAISAGDRDGTWRALSQKKRNQKQREDSLGEESLGEFFNSQFEFGSQLATPGQATAQVRSVDRKTGAVEIYVGNLGYTGSCNRPPRNPSDPWSGLTWVRYENGRWGYEPGFSTTQQRRERWEGAYDDFKLLGFGCNPL